MQLQGEVEGLRAEIARKNSGVVSCDLHDRWAGFL